MTSENTFSGGVFCDTIDGGRVGVQIELLQSGLAAFTPDGDQFVIPYHGCQIEIGGFSGKMVFCRNQDRDITIFCEDPKFPDALSHASAGILQEQLSDQLKQRRGEARQGRRIGMAAILGIALLLVGGYYGIRVAVQVAIHAVPVSVDREIGSKAFEIMDVGGPEINNPAVVEALQSMVDRLAPHASVEGMEFNVHVIDSPEVNAFALPGGTIVVFTGLIEKANDAGQVAGVLSHEMAHATLRHGVERIGQSIGIATTVNLLLGDAQGLIAAGAEMLHFASINSYSREQEAAADEEGVRMLHAAGIDPLALSRFFEFLKQEHADLPEIASWISTHPQHDARIAAVQKQVDGLPTQKYQPLEIDWSEIQQQLKQKKQK